MKKEIQKEMATHSSILAWIIPWTEEPGRLYPAVPASTGDEALFQCTKPSGDPEEPLSPIK